MQLQEPPVRSEASPCRQRALIAWRWRDSGVEMGWLEVQVGVLLAAGHRNAAPGRRRRRRLDQKRATKNASGSDAIDMTLRA